MFVELGKVTSSSIPTCTFLGVFENIRLATVCFYQITIIFRYWLLCWTSICSMDYFFRDISVCSVFPLCDGRYRSSRVHSPLLVLLLQYLRRPYYMFLALFQLTGWMKDYPLAIRLNPRIFVWRSFCLSNCQCLCKVLCIVYSSSVWLLIMLILDHLNSPFRMEFCWDCFLYGTVFLNFYDSQVHNSYNVVNVITSVFSGCYWISSNCFTMGPSK